MRCEVRREKIRVFFGDFEEREREREKEGFVMMF